MKDFILLNPNIHLFLYKHQLQHSIWLEIAHRIQHCDILSIDWHYQLFRGVCCCFMLLHGNLFGNNSFYLGYWILFKQFQRGGYSCSYQIIIGTNQYHKNVQRNCSVSCWHTRVTSIRYIFYMESAICLFVLIKFIVILPLYRFTMTFAREIRGVIICYFAYATISISSCLLVSCNRKFV